MKLNFTKMWLLLAFMVVGSIGAYAQSLSGSYTIGSGTGYDYASPQAAASALMSNGVSGAVTFTIEDGTYSGQLTLNKYIVGSSSTNTITFKSKSADSSKAIITNTGTYTVYMYNCDWVTFEDLTIQSTSTGTRYIIYHYYGENNSFLNCSIIGVRNNRTSYSARVYYSDNTVFRNCRSEGNYYGFYFYGSSTNRHEDNIIDGCTIVHHYYYGVYSYYGQGFTMMNSVIDSAQTGIGYAHYNYYGNGSKIIGNEVNTGYYGLMMYYQNYRGTITSSDTMRIHNNTVGGQIYYPLYMYYGNIATVYHNVFEGTAGQYAMYYYCYRLNKHRFANNIVSGSGGYYGMYVYLGGTSYQPLFWDYNDYFFSNNTYFAYFNGSFANSFTALQGLFSGAYNQNSVSVDPDFPGSGDRRTYAPGLNNAGINLSGMAPFVDTDLDGNKRPNTADAGKVDIGANDFYLAPYDLDVYALVSPQSVNLTTNQVTVQFRNAGSQTISSTDVYVDYSVDSGKTWIQDTMSITSLAPGKVQQFDFTKVWNPTRSGKFGLYVKISKSVSGDPDLLDQEEYFPCSGLAGTFTIGTRPGADYASFGAAVKDLGCGVAGPIVYNVQGGTYTENLLIEELLGATATNTVTFRSPSRDSVILRSTGGNVITLNGADHVAFENMSIRMDGSSGFTVNITNQGDYNRFENCHIYNNTSVTSTASNPVCISGSTTSYSTSGKNGHYNEFLDNDIEGGYMVATVWGNGTANPSVGNKFINNNFKRGYYYGAYMYYTDSLVFQDNNIDDFRYTYNYALMAYYASNFDIQRNYLKAVYYSSLYYANYYNYNNTARSIFANNVMISTGTSYTLYGYRMSHTNFWHNSLYGKGSYMCYLYYMTSNDIRNNIFYYEGSNYCIYTYNPTFVEWDYNDYVIKSGNLAYITGTVISNVSALTAWNSNYNQNNFEEDPEWVDKADDHHVTSKFPEMYGANVGVEIDVDKDDRCTFAPSIGPDEFNQVSLPPTANFLAPDTAWLGSPVVLLNSNKASKTTGAKWYVNGTFASDSIHLEYTPTSAGMDTIQLIMENCSGTDSITKMVFVSPILRAPSVDFSATSRDVYTGDIITLLDLSENGGTQWEWNISPKSVYDPFLLVWSRTHWYLGGKDSTTANPQLYFDYPGIYTVSLKVANSFGGDSIVRTAYIKVRQKATMCDIPWDTDGKIGTLYDNGGELGSYSPGLNGLNKCTYLISDCYGEIDFSIDQFDLGENDYLTVYDGSDDSGRPLWDAGKYPDGMTGNKQDPSVGALTFTAKSGSAYFVFTSDNNSQTIGKGFAIDWEMNPVTWSAPTAAISAPDTVCAGFPTVFTNASTGNFSYVEWDIDGDGNADGSGENFSYTFTTTGYDTIWLDAISLCASKDSTMKVVFVENAKKAPKPDFMASETKVNAGDTVMLTSSSDYCTSGTMWEISPSSYILANNSELDDENIEVVFTRAGFYTIELEKSNSFGKDSVIKTSYIQVLDYCVPSVANLDEDIAISRVKFGSIDNTSSVGKTGYNDFFNLSTDVERGYTYELIVERSSTNKEMNRKVWIDWNIDGDFDDLGELVSQEASSTNKVFTDSIKIDPNAKAGATRMRVAVSYKNLKNLACGPHQFGEFEDYSINILEADKTAPTLTLSGVMVDTIEVFDSWMEPGYTSEDLVDGNLTSAVTVNNPLDTAVVGMYEIVYTVTDNSSNTTTATRTVYVMDRTNPEITLSGDDTVYVQIYTAYNEAGTTESDNYDATLNVNSQSNVDTATLGTYMVNYCVTDANGNGPICVDRTVIVIDTIVPVIILNGNDKEVVEVFSFYTDAGYTVVENDGYTVLPSGNWDGTADSLGVFTLTYTVTDYAGNNAAVTREIEVVDTKAPLIILEGNWIDTVARWADYTDAGVDVSDNYYDAADLVVNVGGTFVNTQSAGVYTITYDAEDPSVNVSQTLTRLVVVIEDLDGTSIGDVDADGFGIFPNPTNGVFYVRTNLDNGQTAQLRVLDLSGKEIYNAGNYVVSNSKFDVNVSDLAAGTYYLEISNSTAKTVKKLIVSK